ncbi:MAG: hypothetical protein EBU75_06835 [Betaproteobacteria bacterium]|nr:hypothetical protein [Betaproteobacteria bacterium]
MIFVSIAAYCDPLLAQTIADACRKAQAPEELVFGVVDQHPHSRRDELLALHPHIQLRYVHVHPVDSRGVCWARSVVFSLYRGEEHLLQIDSHMIFEMAWDGRLKLQLERLQQHYPKPVITNYPWGFTMAGRTPVVDPHRRTDVTLVLKPHPDCALSETSATLRFVADNVPGSEPVPACHLAAGYFFTLGRFTEEVPYDPQLYFHGEEQSLALRAYTRGWDLFHMREVPLYHLYKKPDEAHEGHHWHGAWVSQRDVSHAQATSHAEERLMDLLYQRRDLGAFGLGTERTLEGYAERFGIDYCQKVIRARTDLRYSVPVAVPASTPSQKGAFQASSIAGTDGEFTVVEVNPFAPQPYVFSDAALCLTASLQACGMPSRHVCNALPTRGAVLVVGWTPQWLQANQDLLDQNRTFLFNAEQIDSKSPLLTQAYLAELGRWRVMDYHDANARLIERLHGQAAQVMTVPVIPCEGVRYGRPIRRGMTDGVFTAGPDAEHPIDVLFYGSVNGRRKKVLDDLERRGLKVEVVSGAYGAELTPAIQRAKVVLHAHYYESSLFPALRILQPVAQGVPVVCEHSVFSNWNDWAESGMVFAAYDSIADACAELSQSPARAAEVAAKCWAFAQQMEMVGPA